MTVQYSIIIPHKNSPSLLQKCLNSIPVSDSVQVIVVDDDSDPTIVDFDHFPTWSGREYCVVFSKERKGAGHARNIGLKHAKGRWVLFSDADDFFLDGCLQTLSKVTLDSPDLVFFDAVAIRMDDSGPSHRVDHLNQMHLLYDHDPNKAILRFRYLFGEPWCKLIRRALIDDHGICFDETPIHNDTTFSYLVGHYAKRVVVCHSKFYCVTDSSGSLSKNQTTSVQYVRTKVFARKNRFLYKNGVPLFDSYLLKPFFDCIYSKNWACFIKCLWIARQYGFSFLSILMRVSAPNWQKKLIKLGIDKRLKYSYDV
ncbi:MAG: glycosyltransferase family 2 protein [Bacteroidales bacterium]|nr:glycosyltransferase family 2 protein [Bacteroidales bacterium]